eukprot:TRINITY_DN9036_c1_g2_i1.p2 TRINITY_DN9036_c1_g2~~TRINITY_DN9036_c1_g2_i1.p2  ORF type:complete len:290 (-),score=27.33 TRINITY_DN9036_c1_g2_i1:285-1154(-)
MSSDHTTVEVDNITQGQDKQLLTPEKDKRRKRFSAYDMMQYVLNNIMTTVFFVCAGIALLFFILYLVDLSEGAQCVLLGIFGLLGVALGTGNTYTLGNMSREVHRLMASNKQLEITSAKLEENYDQLSTNNSKLAKDVQKAEDTVEDLKDVSDGLQEKFDEFMELNDMMQNMATKTGQDISEFLESTLNTRNELQRMTMENERALLGRIAQDLEFLDGKPGINQELFARFVKRMPKHLQKRMQSMELNFKEIAGEDKIIDYMEMQNFIDELLQDNNQRQAGLSSSVAEG